MKLIALFIYLLPFVAACQSKTDYETVMAKFQKFYNAAQGDSINAMYSHEWDQN